VRLLVWQWGKRGAGPRIATEVAKSLNQLCGVEALLSLSERAEIMRVAGSQQCDLPVPTYDGWIGFGSRLASIPWLAPRLAARLAPLGLEGAICAMPGPLDLLMAAALRRLHLPFTVVVHDADAHLGDGQPLEMMLQRHLIRRAKVVVTLTRHVGDRLAAQGLVTGRRLFVGGLPPLVFGPLPPPPRVHGGRLRLLFFGRLLPYKGLDLLAAGLTRLGPDHDLDVRVVGHGPESGTLDALRQLPRVQVENRWVAEDEIAELLAWSDALVLPYREASQSGVAAAGLAAGRWVLATRVGGLSEQLAGEPMAMLCEPAADYLAEAMTRLANLPTPDTSRDPASQWREFAASLATF
jgi:glycosyltransferase involved in cell wall biosynthesis